MPKILSNITSDEQVFQIPGTSFTFSGVRPEKLGASEYTLVSIVVDTSGSVGSFSDELLKMLKEVISACQKHPRKENLMVRVVTFNTQLYEVHPFKPVMDIDVSTYNSFSCGGMTALFDATIYSIGASQTYAESMSAHDLEQNAVVFIITDGSDNVSNNSATRVKKTIMDARAKESLQSLLTILIGINTQDCRSELEQFKKEADLNQYVDVPSATPGHLAKLANFISASVSSSSQALASKTASIPVSVTF